jgi:dolichol kinase
MFNFPIVTSLWARGACFFCVLVVFQLIMARIPTEKATKRRLQHALTGHALVQISYVLSRDLALGLLLLGAAGIHICQKYFPSHFRQHFGDLLRPSELSGFRLPGAFYFLLGTAATLALVADLATARYAVECLAFADPIASWIGSSIRSPNLNSGTSVSGSAACFGTAWIIGWAMLDADFRTITIGAMACTVAEGVPYGDDNLNIPIVTALVIERLAKRHYW